MQKVIKLTLACILSLGFSTMTLAGVEELPKSITDSVYNMDLMDSMQPLDDSALESGKVIVRHLGLWVMQVLTQATLGEKVLWVV